MQTSSVRAMAEQATAPTSETIDTPAKLHSNVQHLSPSNINRGFFKLPLELRDQIYDDIATAETQIGLKVTLKDFSSPEVNAYSVKGLGQTCRQIRQEYSDRLQHRIKGLLTEYTLHQIPPDVPYFNRPLRGLHKRLPRVVPALTHRVHSRIIRVADRKVSKGVYVVEDVAVTTNIPFSGMFDHGLPVSNLTLTFASNVDRSYNHKCILDPSLHMDDQAKYWKARGKFHTLLYTASQLAALLKYTNWTGCEHWLKFWWKYQLMYRCEDTNAGLRVGYDWLTFLGEFV